jgi:hypothetical protein
VNDAGNIKWLIERNVFEDQNPLRMAEAVRSGGMTCLEVGFECVSGDDQVLRPTKAIPFADDDSVFVYGSMNLCRWLLSNQKWPKLAWYNFNRLRCQSYYAHWGPFLLQQKREFMPLAEVHRRRDWLYQVFGRDDRIFIRPDDNTKSFPGGIVERDRFEQWWELANFYHPSPDSLAVVAQPQSIEAEWRLVIARRNFVTGSQYRRDGVEEITPGCPPQVMAFAQSMTSAGSFEPHPAYVMDICRTAQGHRLVEIGSICCASLYACDMARVVAAIVDTAATTTGV